METIRFIIANLPVIGQRTLEHVMLVGVAVAIAIITGVTIGILITQSRTASWKAGSANRSLMSASLRKRPNWYDAANVANG